MTAQYLTLVAKLRCVGDRGLWCFVNFNGDMRQPFESLQHLVIEGRPALRQPAHHRHDGAEVTGSRRQICRSIN